MVKLSTSFILKLFGLCGLMGGSVPLLSPRFTSKGKQLGKSQGFGSSTLEISLELRNRTCGILCGLGLSTLSSIISRSPIGSSYASNHDLHLEIVLVGFFYCLSHWAQSLMVSHASSALNPLRFMSAAKSRNLGIIWTLILLFPDLRVMVPLSNLITALAVVRNGVPKMKGLFSSALMSNMTKSTGEIEFTFLVTRDLASSLISTFSGAMLVDIVAEFYSPSRWKELSNEKSSKILPCGDGTCWKTAKVTAIEESKDLTSLSIYEIIENLKVLEKIIKKDSEIVKAKGERKSLALKDKKESGDEECSTFRSDEEYAMAVRDFKKRSKEAVKTRSVKSIENALDVATQIILLENVQNHQKRRTKELLSKVLRVIVVKDKQENDKIKTKLDKNGKRGKAQQCQISVTIKKAKKRRKYSLKGPRMQTLEVVFNQDKRQGLKVQFVQSYTTRAKTAKVSKLYAQGRGERKPRKGQNRIKTGQKREADDQSLSDEDFLEEIFSIPLFDEEIISTKIDPHHFDAESELIESMLNHDSSIISSSLKIDSLLDEFVGELTLLKSISLGIDETDCYPEEDIRLIERLLYDNSSPHPPEEFVFENSDAAIESFFPSPIPNEDSDSHIEEIDLSFNLDDPMPPSIEDDDDESEKDILILEEFPSNYSLSLPENESFYFDIPSFSRPLAKPPNGDTGILNIKMMGDISNQKVPIPKLIITLVLNQKKSPDLLSHRGLEIFKLSAKCPMMIHGKNIPILDVPLFYFYPLDQLKYGGN
nr:transposase, Ptta/En/Spm, transposase, Tnp1/En/Spm-like protein [Tanacetum cinerariifolium]